MPGGMAYSSSFQPKDTHPFDVNLDDLASIRSDERITEKLPSARSVDYFFPKQPSLDHLHIIVWKPDAGESQSLAMTEYR